MGEWKVANKRMTERQWRETVKLWQASGLSQREFCRQAGLPERDLSAWKRRILRSKYQEQESPRGNDVMISTFAPVTILGQDEEIHSGNDLGSKPEARDSALEVIVIRLPFRASLPAIAQVIQSVISTC